MKSFACTALLLAVTCCASPAAPQPVAQNALADPNLSMGRALGRVYVRSNRRALQNDGMRSRASEPCERSDGRISRRPTAAANPPFPPKALAQRIALGNVLQAYEAAAVATVDQGEQGADRTAVAYLRAAKTFSRAANEHAQADLFVDDDAAKFLSDAFAFSAAHNRTSRATVIVRANREFRKLETILAGDFPSASNVAATSGPVAGAMPFCSQPLDIANDGVAESAALVAALVALDAATQRSLGGAADGGAIASRIDAWRRAVVAVAGGVP